MRARVWVIAGTLSLVGFYFHARYHIAHEDVAGIYVEDGRPDVVTTFELKPDGTYEKDDGIKVLRGRWRLKDLRVPFYDRSVVLASGGASAPGDSYQLERRGDKVCWDARDGDDHWCNLAH